MKTTSMIRVDYIVAFIFVLFACKKDVPSNGIPEGVSSDFIAAVDISAFPEIENTSPVFYDLNGNENGFLDILKENDVNTIRLRLWVNPDDQHSGFEEVKQFSQTLKSQGFKIWLTLHYSDTWADPSQQKTPLHWQGLTFSELKDSVYAYTKKVIIEMNPDYIQIGNEINSGILHPQGHIADAFDQFIELMDTAIVAVRTNSAESKIILHYAGITGADWFYNKAVVLDYDIIGLSYYPIWHGKSLDSLKVTMNQLGTTYTKDILIAETAYPFTLAWNDWTNNIVGTNAQLILPEYPATRVGQKEFLRAIKTVTQELENGIGFCYWGAELIAWKGTEATNGSPWENQALFDFDNKALPVLEVFKNE